jgi:methylmalonyl-CoA/ethylmalonyl-CoA epimerase
MIKKIAHIGIAVRNLEEAQSLYRNLLDLVPSHTEHVEDQKVDVSSFHVGETNIELTSGTSDESPITKFIAKRGEGMHHIAFEVDDIHAELLRLKSLGVTLIDEEPRTGADDCLVAFIHPKSTGGVLVELSQKR